jgi:hypothetical protein
MSSFELQVVLIATAYDVQDARASRLVKSSRRASSTAPGPSQRGLSGGHERLLSPIRLLNNVFNHIASGDSMGLVNL